MKLQLTITSSPTVENFRIGDNPRKSKRVGVVGVASTEQLKRCVNSVSSLQHVVEESLLSGFALVKDQLNGAGAANQAANKRPESVTVVGNVQRFFGD